MQTLKSNPGAFLKKNRYTLLALLYRIKNRGK